MVTGFLNRGVGGNIFIELGFDQYKQGKKKEGGNRLKRKDKDWQHVG